MVSRLSRDALIILLPVDSGPVRRPCGPCPAVARSVGGCWLPRFPVVKSRWSYTFKNKHFIKLCLEGLVWFFADSNWRTDEYRFSYSSWRVTAKISASIKYQTKSIEVFGGTWGLRICPIGIQKYPIEKEDVLLFIFVLAFCREDFYCYDFIINGINKAVLFVYSPRPFSLHVAS